MNNLQVSLGSFGTRVLSTTRDGFVLLKGALGNRSFIDPADDEGADAEAEVKAHLSEKGISSQLLRISALAVALKALHYLSDRKWLQTLTSAVSSTLEAPLWLWVAVTSLSWAFIPLVCGTTMAVVMWYTVFLDRCIPGIYHQCPTSVRKHWFSPPPTFHMGHTTAMINLVLLTLLVYFGWDSL